MSSDNLTNFLLHDMVQRFDKEGIETLCFKLDVDFEDFEGTSKSAIARGLILYLNRRGRLAELEKLLANTASSRKRRRTVLKEERTRKDLLKKVRLTWIDDVLNKEFSQNSHITLRLEYKPEAIAMPGPAQRSLLFNLNTDISPNTHIYDIFDTKGGALLILGEAGSGKTITLLELAAKLLDLAEKDDNQPVPVILNLSTWSQKRKPLFEWLVEELNNNYQLNKKFCRKWLESEPFCLLLDGLDEVRKEDRDDCVATINQFRHEHGYGLTSMVVCSRTSDYERLENRLKLLSAINIQPLTFEQVNTYLAAAGEGLKHVHTALQEDVLLQELVQSPLILMILTLAYQDQSITSLIKGTLADRRYHLFKTYTQIMLERQRYQEANALSQQVIPWLSSIAQQMAQHGQTIFRIEQMQPDWLNTNKQKILYKLSLGFIVAIIGWFLFLIVVWLDSGKTSCPKEAAMRGPITILAMGPSCLLSQLSGYVIPAGMIFSLIVVLIIWIGAKLGAEIKLYETYTWSWYRFKLGAIVGSIFGLATWLILFLIDSASQLVTIDESLIFGVLMIGIFGLVFSIIYGMSHSKELEETVRPNQGIWLSAKNAVRVGLIITLAVGFSEGLLVLIVALLFSEFNLESITFNFIVTLARVYLVDGLIAGLIGSMMSGGGTVIQHFTLRFLLFLDGKLPWGLTPFLDSTVNHIILRRIGGGYSFIHRILLEYFVMVQSASQEL